MKSALFFYLFAAVSVLPGIFVLATKDIVRAAFWLLAALSGFAGLYVLLGADFLAVTQVIVYLGGILILILFGVMLTHRDPALVQRARRLNIVVPGIVGGSALAVTALAALTRTHFAVALGPDGQPAQLPSGTFTGTTHEVGRLLVSATDQGRSYALAFELASVLLLAALVGAAYIARRGAVASPAPGAGEGA